MAYSQKGTIRGGGPENAERGRISRDIWRYIGSFKGGL